MYAFTTHTSETLGEAEIDADRRQRHIYDRRIEDDHQIAKTQHDERPPSEPVISSRAFRRAPLHVHRPSLDTHSTVR